MMSLWTLLDDMAGLMDDIGALSKVAAKKTVGVVGDDIAVNAEQVTGSSAERELPIVWAVFKGSMLNKLILVPVALALSAWAPWSLPPLLVLGGAYLCFEAFEKLLHALPGHAADHGAPKAAVSEQDKIKGAIRTDFILSAEIIMIALAAVGDDPGVPQSQQIIAVSALAVGMTVFVYGLVALLVKFDDIGLALTRRDGAATRALGAQILRAAPLFMRTLAAVGTAAMFAVGGSLLVHNVGALHHLVAAVLGEHPASLLTMLADAIVGVVLGAVVFAGVELVARLFRREPAAH